MTRSSSSLPNTTTPRVKAGDAQHRHRRRCSCGGEVHVLVAGHNAGGAAKRRRRRSPAWPRCCTPTREQLRARPGRERRRAGARASPATTATSCSRPPRSGKNVAPRVAAKLDVGADLRHHQGRSAPDTFERPIYAGNAIAIVQSLDAIKVITVRTTGFDPAAADRRQRRGRDGARRWPTAARRSFVGARDRQERPPRAHGRQDHRLGRPRAGLAARSSTKC